MSRLGALTVGAWLLFAPAASHAQTVEVTPFVGYRFGGGFFEEVTQQEVDLDGARTLGAVVNVKLGDDGLYAEAFYSHQAARISVSRGALPLPVDWRITVDHWQGGGLQEFGSSRRARPFLTGLLGLTHYATEGDSEIRFAVAAGGGVKLMPVPNVGLRLDGRVFATFADIEGRAIACGPGACFVALEGQIIWQTEFTAGLVVAF